MKGTVGTDKYRFIYFESNTSETSYILLPEFVQCINLNVFFLNFLLRVMFVKIFIIFVYLQYFIGIRTCKRI